MATTPRVQEYKVKRLGLVLTIYFDFLPSFSAFFSTVVFIL
jgi:hypothetical protein